MAELPILPIATDAILADTSHMSAEEFGVYCRLLFVMWRHGAKLTFDQAEFANIAGVPLKRWQVIQEKVMRPMQVHDGIVTQKKLTETWDKVQLLRVKRVAASNKRWSSKYDASGVQMHMQNRSRSNAIPKPNKNNTSPVTTSEREEPPEEASQVEPAKAPHAVSASELAVLYAKKNTATH